MKTNMQFMTWLDLAASASMPTQQEADAAISLRPVLVSGQQRCLGVTMNGRWLRGHDGRLTVFDTLGSASRFLQLLKLDHFSMGGLFDGSVLSHVQRFRLDGSHLSACDTPISHSNRRPVEKSLAKRHTVKRFIAATQSIA
ncbi:MAG: hypothetical protein Q8S26_05510 [Azonexus sp.]|nr:hypothetical protein [Azonexus sp.]